MRLWVDTCPKYKKTQVIGLGLVCAPSGIRTLDTLIKSQLL